MLDHQFDVCKFIEIDKKIYNSYVLSVNAADVTCNGIKILEPIVLSYRIVLKFQTSTIFLDKHSFYLIKILLLDFVKFISFFTSCFKIHRSLLIVSSI